AVATPILAYFGISGSDLTTWGSLFGLILDALKNPYVVGLVLVSLWNNVINPVTKGITD
ncbi:MAG: phage holin, partial [Thomasclavelia ramosa]